MRLKSLRGDGRRFSSTPLGSAPTRIDACVPDLEELAKMAPNKIVPGLVNFQQQAVHLWILDFNKWHTISMHDIR